jgi:hypothetical protein
MIVDSLGPISIALIISTMPMPVETSRRIERRIKGILSIRDICSAADWSQRGRYPAPDIFGCADSRTDATIAD